MSNNLKNQCSIGIIGLGVMGRNLLLNMSDQGFKVAGYDKDLEKVKLLNQEGRNTIAAAQTIEEFLSYLSSPKAIMMLIPAGLAVDSVIEEVEPLLNKEDILIDGGNSYFKDTNVRTARLWQKGIYFLGIGISGGEEGARHGPSFMPGGQRQAYERIRAIFEATAAKAGNEPCVAYLGPGSAGHYVKMVHNGIEYGIMQLIAESYDFMKRGLGLNDDELYEVFKEWNEAELNSYLIEITSHIFKKVDEKTGKRLINVILDSAKQKGTGKWTSQSAMELQVPTPTINISITVRNLSMNEQERMAIQKTLPRPILPYQGDEKSILKSLRNALYASLIMTYAQGMELLRVASQKFEYHLELKTIARIWRAGCIIRSKFLENIYEAYHANPTLENLLMDTKCAQLISEREKDLRTCVSVAAESGIPFPSFSATLSYLDSYRSGWLPANLIQAQRDYFGAHQFERNDSKGTFHVNWGEEEL